MDIVNKAEHNLFFHKYTFDESQLQSGAVYARIEARKDRFC